MGVPYSSPVSVWWCCSVPRVCVCVWVCVVTSLVSSSSVQTLTCFTSSSPVWTQWPCHPARSHRLRWGQMAVSLLCRQRILHTQIKSRSKKLASGASMAESVSLLHNLKKNGLFCIWQHFLKHTWQCWKILYICLSIQHRKPLHMGDLRPILSLVIC